MRMFVTIIVAGMVSTAAVAEDGAVKMSRDELLTFLPEAKVTHVSKSGSQRMWTNAADGTLLASTDNKKYGGAMGIHGSSAQGTWKVDDDGKYCVGIDWKREAEKWCAYVLKTADAYYLNAVDPSRKIEFKK